MAMLYHSFPDLQWLKNQAESRFSNGKAWNGKKLDQAGWPTVMLNVKAEETFRDNIPGPLSLFSTSNGKSFITVEGKRVHVSDDYFFISNAHQRYTLEIEKGKPAEVFNIHFGEKWAEKTMASILLKPATALDDPDQALPSVHFYNKLFHKDKVIKSVQKELMLTKDEGSLKQEELLYSLMIYLIYQQELITRQSLSIPVIKSATREELLKRLFLATDYIYSFYNQSLSLEELAKISCLSKFHFLRLFKQVFHQTPYQFITEIRISKAMQLLKHPKAEVKQVAKQLGFADASTFSRLFHNQQGVYPGQFAKSGNR
jgi:AraC family transcriptional regulator